MTRNIKAQLHSELADLLDRESRMQAHLRGGASLPDDWTDRNSATQGDAVLELLDRGAIERIGALREALGRIDDGDYGVCAACGAAVPEARLLAMPTARTCVSCTD